MSIIASPERTGLKAALNTVHTAELTFTTHLLACYTCLTPGVYCQEGDAAEQQLVEATNTMLVAAREYAPIGRLVAYRGDTRWFRGKWTVAGHMGAKVVLVRGDERVAVPVEAVSL